MEQKDELLRDIESQIQVKQKFLKHKQDEIERTSKINHFLRDVLKDYKNHAATISREKERYRQATKRLSDYVDFMLWLAQ